MCRAVGQLQVCVLCFKQIIFCVAEGKYSKPQKITHLLGFVRRGRGCSRVRMCSEFDSLVQGRLHKEMQRAGFSVNTMEACTGGAYSTWAHCRGLGVSLRAVTCSLAFPSDPRNQIWWSKCIQLINYKVKNVRRSANTHTLCSPSIILSIHVIDWIN